MRARARSCWRGRTTWERWRWQVKMGERGEVGRGRELPSALGHSGEPRSRVPGAETVEKERRYSSSGWALDWLGGRWAGGGRGRRQG